MLTAASVPKNSETGVTMLASRNEFRNAPSTFGSRRSCAYHVSVNRLKGSAMMIESLNEKTTRMTSGTYRSATTVARNAQPSTR